MKWLMRLLLAVAILIAAYYWIYPDYSYRYRLTVEIESGGQTFSGSSVIEVTWHGQPDIPDAGSYRPTLGGQAVVVDLPNNAIVVATLINGEGYGPPYEPFGPWGALWLVPRAFHIRTEVAALKDWSPTAGQRPLADDNLPLLLWLPNRDDPKSAQKIMPSAIPPQPPPTPRWIRASVEITQDPIAVDIGEKIPWIAALDKSAISERSSLYLPNGLVIHRYLFIGDAS